MEVLIEGNYITITKPRWWHTTGITHNEGRERVSCKNKSWSEMFILVTSWHKSGVPRQTVDKKKESFSESEKKTSIFTKDHIYRKNRFLKKKTNKFSKVITIWNQHKKFRWIFVYVVLTVSVWKGVNLRTVLLIIASWIIKQSSKWVKDLCDRNSNISDKSKKTLIVSQCVERQHTLARGKTW